MCRLNAKNRVQAGEENLVVSSVRSCRKIQQKKNRNVVIVQSGENIILQDCCVLQKGCVVYNRRTMRYMTGLLCITEGLCCV